MNYMRLPLRKPISRIVRLSVPIDAREQSILSKYVRFHTQYQGVMPYMLFSFRIDCILTQEVEDTLDEIQKRIIDAVRESPLLRKAREIEMEGQQKVYIRRSESSQYGMFRDRMIIQVFKPLLQQERIDLLIKLG
jgi:hypothetical protein